MTPQQIIDFGKMRHQVLLYDDPSDLESLIRYTLIRYEAKASVLKTAYLEEDPGTDDMYVSKPSDFKSLVYCEDDRGRFCVSRLRPENTVEKIYIKKDEDGATAFPVKIHYLASIASMGLGESFPSGVNESLIMDHFFAMLDRENAKLLRQASAVTGIQDSSEADETLTQRILALEGMFDAEQAMIPPITVR